MASSLTPKFRRLNGKVYWSTATIKGADFDSFEVLNFIWARDKHRVYSYNSPLHGADRHTFTVLSALFAKDKHRAYYLSGAIRDADSATFRALDAGWFESAWPGVLSVQGYAADGMHVFHHVLTVGEPRPIKGADTATFHVLERAWAVDRAWVYWEGSRLAKADPKKFRPLGHYYGTDGQRVYYGNTIVAVADADTFRVGPDQLHGFDKHRKYDRHEVLA